MQAEATTPAPAPATPTAWTWSDQQNAIFEWFREGRGHLVVRARAGTGKTTTILEGISHAPEPRILLCAFNKRIAVELEEKLQNPRAKAQTLHSLGFQFLRAWWQGVTLDNRNRKWNVARAAIGEQAPDEILGCLARLHTLGREIAPKAAEGMGVRAWWLEHGGGAILRDIAWAFDCLPGAEWKDFGWDDDAVIVAAGEAMRIAAQRPPRGEGIDFSDMLYLPVVNGMLRPAFDLVVVDEMQDMNPCQLLIAQAVVEPEGRFCGVGDDRQGIYGFRGADTQSLDRIKDAFGAAELGLTTTYRCGKVIVERARALVPDFEAGPSNPDGTLDSIRRDQLEEQVRPGDAVLSRTDAPLVGSCLRLLRAGTPARVEGRDVAAGIRTLIKKLATGKARQSIPALLEKLATWEEREIARAKAADPNGKATAKCAGIQDKAEVLRELAAGASGIPELKTRVDHVFSEISEGRCVVFSTVHKAKGLEWSRVFVLMDTFRSAGETSEEATEEANIRYVAYTRAKDHLTLVVG